jgi:hypothetical protein
MERCRFGYINWLWYGWGALMINQYEHNDVQIYSGVGVLEYYSLNGMSKWAFLGYSALSFVVFFFIAYIVSGPSDHSVQSLDLAFGSTPVLPLTICPWNASQFSVHHVECKGQWMSVPSV